MVDTSAEALRMRIRDVRRRMELTCLQFLQTTESFAWECLIAQAERATAAHTERLLRLKSDRHAVTAKIRQVIAVVLNTDDVWRHRASSLNETSEGEEVYAWFDDEPPRIVDARLRELTRHLEALLARYSLVPARGRGDAPVCWSEDMTLLMHRYASLERTRRALTAVLESYERHQTEATMHQPLEQEAPPPPGSGTAADPSSR
jgi:hypothetical protein